MAARKTMLGPRPSHPSLDEKVRASLAEPMTDAQFNEQKASFAYGNATTDLITKDSVRRAINSFRLKSI